MSDKVANSISIGFKDNNILIIAIGDMRAGECFALNEYLLPYLENSGNKKQVYIDLNSCNYMDSTFIGFIVALTIKCRKNLCDIVKIVNPSEKAVHALRKVSGMKEINVIEKLPFEPFPVFKLASNPESFKSYKNVELMFESHRVLSEISEENRQEFSFLMEELKRVLDSKI